jgi:hypothetical protein
MKPRMLFAGALMLATLSACVTPETPKIVDTTCSAFGAIGYAIPPVQPDGSREVVDTGNDYDTLETVEQVSIHNARYDALCGKRP